MANTDSGVKMKSLKRAGLKVETEAFTMAAKKKKKKNLFTKNYQASIR